MKLLRTVEELHGALMQAPNVRRCYLRTLARECTSGPKPQIGILCDHKLLIKVPEGLTGLQTDAAPDGVCVQCVDEVEWVDLGPKSLRDLVGQLARGEHAGSALYYYQAGHGVVQGSAFVNSRGGFVTLIAATNL